MDGNGNAAGIAIDLSALDGVVPQYPYSRGSKLAMPPQSFICNPYSLEDPNSLDVMRYATAWFTSGTIAAGNDPIVFAPTTLVLWNHGQADDASAETGFVTKGGVALPLNLSQTNALKEGAIPKGGEWFLIEAMGCALTQCCNIGGSVEAGATLTTAPKQSFYEAQIARALLANVTLNVEYVDTKNESDIGLAGQYPAMCQPTNQQDIVSNGQTMPGMDMKFAFNYFTGSRCGCDQINMNVVLQNELIVANDTNQPTLEGDVFQIGLRVELYGASYCLSTIEALVGVDAAAKAFQVSRRVTNRQSKTKYSPARNTAVGGARAGRR